MKPVRPWLDQGDVFADVPRVRTTHTGNVIAAVDDGPALLLTHGCALDKRTGSGVSTLERVQFMPLHHVGSVDAGRQALLRRREFNPAEAFYVGEVGDVGELFGLLSEIYTLPVSVFDPHIATFDHPDAEPGGHLAIREKDTRVVALDGDELELLHKKIDLFFTRSLWEADPAPPSD